jgi:hypothetical protein
MIITVGDILKDAMGLCNATEIDETPSSSEMAIALRAANVMLGRWSAQKLLLRADTRITFSTVADQASYTIGSSGADITSVKPLRINSGYVTDGGIDYPLDVYTGEMYDNLIDKAVSPSRPAYVAYDPGAAQQTAQKGTLYFSGAPDKVYTVTLKGSIYLTEFVNFTDQVSFEPVYYEALIYGLAVRLFRRYSDDKTPVPADLTAIASESLKSLKSLNAVRVPAMMDLPPTTGRYDALTDSSS